MLASLGCKSFISSDPKKQTGTCFDLGRIGGKFFFFIYFLFRFLVSLMFGNALIPKCRGCIQPRTHVDAHIFNLYEYSDYILPDPVLDLPYYNTCCPPVQNGQSEVGVVSCDSHAPSESEKTPKNSMGVSATPTRESRSIRNAQVQAE